jgi:hypothetical protein
MRWKQLFAVGLIGALASPAFAEPTLTVTGSRLTRTTVPANARRIWNIAVTPDLALSPTGSPLALELGFRATGGNIISASAAQNSRRVERPNNPGNVIFGWETLTDVGGGNMQPVGIQIGTGDNANTAVAFLGTADLPQALKYDLLTIATDASVTSLEWGGRFNADGTMAPIGTFASGRIGHVQGESATNFHSYAGSLPQNAPGATRFLGDMNGDGNTNFADLAPLGNAFSPGVPTPPEVIPHLNRLGRGDINGDGAFNFADLAPFGQIILGAPGAAAGFEVASVPEPATWGVALLGITIGVLRARRASR